MKYLFRDASDLWRTASDTGIQTGLRCTTGDLEALTFDTSITLAHHYRDQADDAAALGFSVAAKQWLEWAGILESWAAIHHSAPGRVLSASVTIRYNVAQDDSMPTFSEMVGHAQPVYAGGDR